MLLSVVRGDGALVNDEQTSASDVDDAARGRPNDCRINCKTASHSDGDRGTPVAPHSRMEVRPACRRRAWIAPSGALAPRANIRRFVNFLQLLGGACQLALECAQHKGLAMSYSKTIV